MAQAAFDDDPYGMGQPRRRTSVSGAQTGTAVSTTPMAVPRGTAPTPPRTPPYEEGGITGGSGGAQPEPPAPPTLYGIGGGFDQAKLGRPQGESFKYDWINAARKYDPTKGITSDLLRDLNAFGYGTFSGGGQHLSLSGLTDKGRAAGLLGDYRDADMITGFANGTNPGAVWGYQDPFAESMNSGGGTGSLDGLLAAFSQPTQPTANGFISPEQMAAILKTLTPPPAAPSAPPMTFTLPEPEQTQSPVSQDMTAPLVSGMGSPEVGRALQVIAMKYPGLFTSQPQGDPNSLVAQLMRLIGGGGGVYA